MLNCSGAGFNTALLSSCLLNGNCDFGLSAYAVAGSMEGQSWNSVLSIKAPPLEPDKISACVNQVNQARPNDYDSCISNTAIAQQSAAISGCDLSSFDEDRIGRCIIACLSG